MHLQVQCPTSNTVVQGSIPDYLPQMEHCSLNEWFIFSPSQTRENMIISTETGQQLCQEDLTSLPAYTSMKVI